MFVNKKPRKHAAAADAVHALGDVHVDQQVPTRDRSGPRKQSSFMPGIDARFRRDPVADELHREIAAQHRWVYLASPGQGP